MTKGFLKNFTCFVLLIGVMSCGKDKKFSNYEWRTHKVTVSAYNSVSWQTQGDPNVAAWGDTLKPGMKVIAISRDLGRLGIGHNTKILIESLPDTFLVKDRMHSRWRNRIDMYMGTDVKKATEWGRKKLTIRYAIPKKSEKSKTKP